MQCNQHSAVWIRTTAYMNKVITTQTVMMASVRCIKIHIRCGFNWSVVTWGPCHRRVLRCKCNSMEIALCSHPNSNEIIATNIFTWYESCSFMACWTICSDLYTGNGFIRKLMFRLMWITIEKLSQPWIQFRSYVTSKWRSVNYLATEWPVY